MYGKSPLNCREKFNPILVRPLSPSICLFSYLVIYVNIYFVTKTNKLMEISTNTYSWWFCGSLSGGAAKTSGFAARGMGRKKLRNHRNHRKCCFTKLYTSRSSKYFVAVKQGQAFNRLLSYFFKKITHSRGLWYARMGLYVTLIRLGLLSTPNQITDSKCVSSE